MARLGMKTAAFSYVGNDDLGAVDPPAARSAKASIAAGLLTHPHGRHEHHGRADRPERRAEFRPLRRRPEADEQVAAPRSISICSPAAA